MEIVSIFAKQSILMTKSKLITDMNIKKLIPLIVLYLGVITSGCTNNDSTTTDITISDAQIKSFKLLKNDSVISGLEEIVFSIDQYNNYIYNSDSLPFGTLLKEKLLAEITFNSASEAKILTVNNDTTIYSSSDSIDFSSPVNILVTAHDKKTTKEYTVKVNIHQVDPDSMTWVKSDFEIPKGYSILTSTIIGSDIYCIAKNENGINSLFSISTNNFIGWVNNGDTNIEGEVSQLIYYNDFFWAIADSRGLYRSNNGINWIQINNSVESILGTIDDELVYVENGDRSIVSTKDFISFKRRKISTDFPSHGFGSTKYYNGVERLIIIGGNKSSLEPTNSVYQIYLANNDIIVSGDIHSKNGSWKARGGITAQYYNEKIYIFSGNNGNIYYDEIYTSINGGVNWVLSTEKSLIPESYGKRSYANAHLDEKNAIWFIGGNNNQTSYNDIWKAQINKLK